MHWFTYTQRKFMHMHEYKCLESCAQTAFTGQNTQMTISGYHGLSRKLTLVSSLRFTAGLASKQGNALVDDLDNVPSAAGLEDKGSLVHSRCATQKNRTGVHE